MNDEMETVPFRIVLQGDAVKEPPVESIASLLRHLVYLHDRLVILVSPKYRSAAWSSHFFYRTGRPPLKNDELLKVYYLKQESPIEIGIIISAALASPLAAKAFVELLKMIRDRNLDREYKVLRNEKLQLENELLRLETERLMRDLEIENEYLLKQGRDDKRERPSDIVAKDVLRIAKDDIKIKEVKVTETTRRSR
ncbi:MAG: hypothetical protein D4R82_02895 [Dehalococcoidia bacterium]|nr:MAG: hypothetical protein D4R82_02895 [Dehalococcoidia bacterium]